MDLQDSEKLQYSNSRLNSSGSLMGLLSIAIFEEQLKNVITSSDVKSLQQRIDSKVRTQEF
jgi:hypothetical protein